eukprot:1595564-Rhodomonas_salina.1
MCIRDRVGINCDGSVSRSKQQEEEEKLCFFEEAVSSDFRARTKVIAEPHVTTYPSPMNILVQQGIGIPTVPPVAR